MGRHVQLWGGPMDGAAVFVGDGDLPARVGMHRTADDALVPIRGSAQLNMPVVAQHVQVYERAGLSTCAIIAVGLSPWLARLDEHVPVYVHRELITRWIAQS